MTATAEKREFQAEARQLLDLMIHSIYSNKDIFLRELISNASDALDKLRVEALKNPELAGSGEPEIRIEADKEARTLTISDTGIGMSRDEVIRYIGTIAKSGTKEFASLLKEGKQEGITPELIGQFGVGFYSSFMAAERIELVTRRAGESQATRWESAGDGYTLEDAERESQGTTITLHLKPEDEEDGLHDYTSEWKIREIVKTYSDFVTYPIKLKTEKKEEGKEPEIEWPTINSMKAIWTRGKDEASEEEYKEFYKHVSHDWGDPLKRINLRGEGTVEFYALLYIPSRAPFDLFHPETKHGIHLYVKRVFIMEDCSEIIPRWLRFLRGVVDSEDLSLNISREILQQNRQIRQIGKRIVKKVLDTLDEMKRNERAAYEGFWKEFGRVIKEGAFQDFEHRERLLDLCLFESTTAEGWTTLDEYVGRMKDGQETIHYLTGESRAMIEASPHLEGFKDKGYEVLILADPIDELWTQAADGFKGKKFQSAAKGAPELGSDEEKKKAEEDLKEKSGAFGPLLERLKEALKEEVKDVRLSTRLTSSAACLVGEGHDMSPHLEQLLRAANQPVPKNKRILEINPKHPLLEKLRGAAERQQDDPALAEAAELLYGQALLAEGSPLPDPARFSRLVAEVMARTFPG